MGESGDYSVTVTVPIYNSSRFIDDCLRYISEQTYDILEVIFVVDERTTDGSEQLLKEKAKTLGNVRVVMQSDDGGLAGARNIGIRESKGDVIWFLDVDDIPHLTFLEELIRVMKETDSDMAICNNFQTFERKMLNIPNKDYSYTVVDGSYAVEHYTDYPIYSWSRIQKRSVFSEESVFRSRPAAEDIEQTIRQYAVSKKVCYYNKPLYVYVKSKRTASANNRSKELKSLELTAKSILPFVKERLPENYNGFKKTFLLNMMRQSTFSKYHSYREWYSSSCCRLLVKNAAEKTFEMKVFSVSKTLYYLILFPFSHCIWDRKKGLWDKS